MMRCVLRILCTWSVLVLAGCATPLVGGECREGFTPCDGLCVDLQTDRQNCGACGNACATAEACVLGICVLDDGGGVDGSAAGVFLTGLLFTAVGIGVLIPGAVKRKRLRRPNLASRITP